MAINLDRVGGEPTVAVSAGSNRIRRGATLAGGLILAAGLLGLGVQTGRESGVAVVDAQRDVPPDFSVEHARHGRRYVLPLPDGPLESPSRMIVTNAGYTQTRVVAIAVDGANEEPGCGAGQVSVRSARCVAILEPGAITEIAIDGSGPAMWLVYSVAVVADAACSGLPGLVSGRTRIAEWEVDHWSEALGDRLAARAELVRGGAVAAVPAIASSGFAARAREIDPLAFGAALAGVRGSASLAVANTGPHCAPVRFASRGEQPPGFECPAATTFELEVPPAGMIELADPVGAPRGIGFVTRGELGASATWHDSDGLRAADAPMFGGPGGGGRLAFPIAVGPLEDAVSTLHVTNQHASLDARIDLIMWDGNRSLRKAYSDPEPLCPGATRTYDITELAGEIPRTTGRGDAGAPPLLSLRVEATAEGSSTQPPIAGVLEISSPLGVAAYAGLNLPVVIASPRGIDGRPVRTSQAGVTVIPGVMANFGPDRRSTVLAVQTVNSNVRIERQALIAFYDASGTLVGEPLRLAMGEGPAGFVDLSTYARRFGDDATFYGTAVIQGSLGRGTIGAAALTIPAAGRAGGRPPSTDALTLVTGNFLRGEADPSLPTPTTFPTPTRGPSRTPGAGSPTPEATPTEVRPTDTTPPGAYRALMPYAARQ